ncbi:MAG: hypothetical protein ACJ0Q2_04395 [Candidatus Azotimanducaceae bacterium]
MKSHYSNLILVAQRLAVLIIGLSLSLAIGAKKFDEISFDQVQEIKKGKAESYVTANGEKFIVGQTITIGKPKVENERHYQFLELFLNGWVGYMPMTVAQSAGQEVKIQKITFKDGKVTIHSKWKNRRLRITDFESALEFGEIISRIQIPKKVAISKLKEAKELLDLEVISQEEYDELKESLMPFLKQD